MEQVVAPEDLRFDEIRHDVFEANRSVRFGNLWMFVGLVAGSVLAVFFGWIAMDGVGWLQKLTIGANVLVTAWVVFMVLRARRVSRSDDWTLRSRLEIEIQRLEKQRALWSYGGVWFWGPMSVPVLLGLPVRLYWVWFVLCALLCWIVHRGTRTSVDPLLSRLRALHRELLDGDDSVRGA